MPRNEQLKAMIEQFFERHLVPVAEKRLENRQVAAVADARKALDQRLGELGKDQASAQRWIELFGLKDLLHKVSDQNLIQVADDDLLTEIERSEAMKKWAGELDQNVDEVLNELRAGWQKLSDEFTDRFRTSAKTSATIVGILVAFMLNIDALYILDVYMNDGDTRAAVLAQQASLTRVEPSESPAQDLDQGLADIPATGSRHAIPIVPHRLGPLSQLPPVLDGSSMRGLLGQRNGFFFHHASEL